MNPEPTNADSMDTGPMNADPAGTRDAHLELEDLIAEASGQPASDRARTHLASCESCRREVTRWNLVADGVPGTLSGRNGVRR